MSDVLILGSVVFDSFSTPSEMPFGGKHMMEVHKLIGGRRVIDCMGPDDSPLRWSGEFFGNNAYAQCLLIDSLRAQGQQLPLIFAGQARTVVIHDFRCHIKRLPTWCEYEISCIPLQNGAGGAVLSTVDALVSNDLAALAGMFGQ